MGVDSVNGGLAYTGYLQSSLLQSTQNTASVQDTDGDNDKGKAEGAHQGGGQPNAFMNSVMQTLNQLGIAPTIQPNAPQAAMSLANTGGENTKTGADNRDNQALPAFMYNLFQALNQNSQGAQNPVGAVTSDNLTAHLQNLLQSLTSNAAGTNSTVSQLASSFQNLIQTLQGGSGAATGGLSSLQTFLQTLIQNLPEQKQGTTGTGVILSTTA